VSEKVPGIRPRPTLWRRLDAAGRAAFPATTTALTLLATAFPLGLPGQAQWQPAAALACVFFWSLFRPASMPPAVVFLLGLLADLLGLSPVGASVLVLLIVHGCAVSWRRVLVRQGFVVVWLAFVAVAAGAALLQWALVCLLTFHLFPIAPALFEFALTAGLYPLLATMFVRFHRGLADPYQA
jgi:rod shape-determining protein MreD